MDLFMARDGNDSLYIQWEQVPGIYKRAWVQTKPDPDKDWAGSGRYLNVVRCNDRGNPAGNATDFPIFNDLPDEVILRSFVHMVTALTGPSLHKAAE